MMTLIIIFSIEFIGRFRASHCLQVVEYGLLDRSWEFGSDRMGLVGGSTGQLVGDHGLDMLRWAGCQSLSECS